MPTSPISCSPRSIRPCGALQLPGGTPVVAADTVGFIRELPHELVAAFQSTLTEARAATLLLHVVDASNPRRDEQIEQVDAVLDEIGAQHIPQLLVYNKIDRLEGAPRIERDADGRATAVWISAQHGARTRAAGHGASPSAWRALRRRARLRMPASAGALRSRLYAAQVVRGETSARRRLDRARRGTARPGIAGAGPHHRRADSGGAAVRTRLVPPRTSTYNRPPVRARPSSADARISLMAWNQPNGGQERARGAAAPGRAGSELDERLKSWQRKLESLLRRPGGGSGGSLSVFRAAVHRGGVARERGLPGRPGRARRRAALRCSSPRCSRRACTSTALADRDASPRSTSWTSNSSDFKSRVLTSDVNLVDLHFAVQYQFTDPVKKLFA